MAPGTWPVAGGQVGGMLRGWGADDCALGAPAHWPRTLRTTLQLLICSPSPMTLLWGARGILLYNDAYAVIAGAKHPAILGMSAFDAWPEVDDLHVEVMARVMAGEPLSYSDLAVVLHRNGVAESVTLDVDYSPVRDETGAVLGVLAVVFDKTQEADATRARLAAEAALHERERQLAQVQRIGRVGGLEVDLRGPFRNKRSPEYLAIHGLAPDAVNETHEAWVARIHPLDRALTEAHFRETVAGLATDYQAEYRIIRPSDGAIRWISAVALIERAEDGAPLRLIGAHLDITDAKENEARQDLLMQELAHRVKNSLAMIQAIASQTLRSAVSLEQAREVFNARLSALARAHDLLVSGGGAEAELSDIVASVIGIQGEPDRFETAGPALRLLPKPALALALILHELATNAVKYGALSNDTGRVLLHWRIDEIDGELHFRLRWREQGGPPVLTPTRTGFGSRLIERSFPAAQARAETSYPSAGVIFTLDATLSALHARDG